MNNEKESFKLYILLVHQNANLNTKRYSDKHIKIQKCAGYQLSDFCNLDYYQMLLVSIISI